MPRSEIQLKNCQIKSLEKLRLVAAALNTLEVEIGIKEVRITLDDCFICPDITDEQLDTLNQTPMEKALQYMIRKSRNK